MPLQKLPVTGLDDINHRRRSREVINQVLDHSFDDSRRQTDVEKRLGITPVNAAFDPYTSPRYGAVADDSTDNLKALTDLFTAAAAANQEAIVYPGTHRVSAALSLVTNLRVRGYGKNVTTIRADANTYSVFSDGNSPVTDVVISDMTIDATSIGSSNRAILFDADTADVCERITIERVRVTSMFRGVEADRVNEFRVRDCDFTGLSDVGVYVGNSLGTGVSTKVSITGCLFKDNGATDTSGGLEISYADEVMVNDNHFDTVGATGSGSGLTTLYHAIYYRSITKGTIANNIIKTVRRGAGIHVYADVGASEPRNTDITITGNTIDDAENYVGIRCDQVRNLTVSGNIVRKCYNNALYITNIASVAITGNTLLNNNEEEASGTSAGAAIRLENAEDFTVCGNTALENQSTGSQYGQNCFIRFAGTTNFDGTIVGNTFKFSGATSHGYYLIDAQAAVSYMTVIGNVQNGASRIFEEGTTCTLLTFSGNIVVGNGSSQFLTQTQLHKFVSVGNINQGVPVTRSSDGTYITARTSSSPSGGAEAWVQGDIAWRTTPSAAAAPGYVCTSSGTPGTWKEMGDLDA